MFSVKTENIHTGKIYCTAPTTFEKACDDVRSIIMYLTYSGWEEGIDFDIDIIDADEIPEDYNPGEDWN